MGDANLTPADTQPMALSPLGAMRRAVDLLTGEPEDIEQARVTLHAAIDRIVAGVTAPDEGLVRRDAAATSRAAATMVAVRSGTQRARVLAYLVHHGPSTDPEIADALGLGPNSARPRRVELVDGGFVTNGGVSRLHAGAEHAVCRGGRTGPAAVGGVSGRLHRHPVGAGRAGRPSC